MYPRPPLLITEEALALGFDQIAFFSRGSLPLVGGEIMIAYRQDRWYLLPLYTNRYVSAFIIDLMSPHYRYRNRDREVKCFKRQGDEIFCLFSSHGSNQADYTSVLLVLKVKN